MKTEKLIDMYVAAMQDACMELMARYGEDDDRGIAAAELMVDLDDSDKPLYETHYGVACNDDLINPIIRQELKNEYFATLKTKGLI